MEHRKVAERVESIQLLRIEPAGNVVEIPEYQEARRQRSRPSHRMFYVLVVVPTIAAILYFGLIAAPRYVSEVSYVVRSSAYQSLPNLSQAAGMPSLRASTDHADAVNSYILSRDMVDLLEKQNGLREMFSRDEADFIYRFPNFYRKDNREQLYRHYLKMVDASVDKATGISTISVAAFSPDDSRMLATALVEHAEQLINRLNDRMVADAEAYAKSAVERARDHVVAVALQLANYRNTIGSVDPSRESAKALDQIAQMATEPVETQAALQQHERLSPSSPALPGLRERIRTYQEQIEKEKLRVVGNDQSMSTQLSEFEKLNLDRQLAARAMESAMNNLAGARQDAQRQHLYLQKITEPNLADEALYPRRLLGITVVFLLGLSIFVIFNSVYKNIVRHGT